MQVSKWGNSLAIRLPASVVKTLELHEGDDIEIKIFKTRQFQINKKPDATTQLKSLRKFRDRMPTDFIFDREEIHTRG